VSGAGNGAERAENGVSRSGAESGHLRKTLERERSMKREAAEQERSEKRVSQK